MKLFSAVSIVSLMLSFSFFSAPVQARQALSNAVESTKRTAESQIRTLIEPVIDKYCHEDCKLMSINAMVDLAEPDEVSPGFDDVDPRSVSALAPSSARVKVLIDEKIGPISRDKLLTLLQQHLDTLDFKVKIDTQLVHFPEPIGSAAKVADLRERITKQFKGTVDDLIRQFCPDQCLLADYDLQTESVNPEEVQYGANGEYFQDSGVALRLKNLSASILVDDTLSAEERNNIVEMARLKTNFLKNITLTSKSLKFPRPTTVASRENAAALVEGANGLKGRAPASDKNSTEKNTTDEKSTSTLNQNNQSENKSLSETKSNSTNSSNTSSNNSNNQNSTANNNETNNRQERFEKYEKIERVESGDAVQAELKHLKTYGLVFSCAVLALLIFIALSTLRVGIPGFGGVQRIIQQMTGDPVNMSAPAVAPRRESSAGVASSDERIQLVAKRYEIERLIEELTNIFAQQPRVAKQVFSRILTEEGVETSAKYIHVLGEYVVLDMLRDPSLQSDMNELMEFYARNPVEVEDDEKLDLLKRLHNRTVAGKLVVMGSRSSSQYDFLAEMDGTQVVELIRNESLTVKSIILTQVDPQKRSTIYAQLDPDTRMKLLAELARIDYLPRDYIANVATALRRKRQENPRLNTEALPGSDVLVNLLERTGSELQHSLMRNLESNNPDSARSIKSKLVSIDTLRYLKDGQLLEVILSLKHDELLQFLKGAPAPIQSAIRTKSPSDLISEIDEELTQVGPINRETYQVIERKVLNRMKIMANEGLINLAETNERMFTETEQKLQAGGSADFTTTLRRSG